MNAMQKMTEGMIKENQPKFEVGDTVRVSVRIKEGDKERIQAFEGTVIAKKHGGIAETFTVRRTSYGVGVERVFPVQSCSICAAAPARPPRSRLASDYRPICSKRGGRLAFFPFCFINFYARQGGLDWLWQVPL